MSSSTTTYDEVPYFSKPLYATHPNLLAAAGRLRGLDTPAPSRCRVLELGCAGGGNLIPMAAALPESQFVGIDLSERQIAEGQELTERCALKNIRLIAGSIADIDQSFGEFDYIICHGVFSWVPPAIQDKILWICRLLLSPQGIAYVSYNTYPGWHHRTIIRDLMKFHAARFDDPATQVQQARSIVNFMAEASASLDSPHSRVLASEAKDLPEAADYYLFHEHLEDFNQPLYFHQFVARSRAAGLEYLGEAWHHTQIDNLPAEVQETLQAISGDVIDLEQFVDFIRNRTFRRTLLCRQECPIVRDPQPSVMNRLFLSALARPESPDLDIRSAEPAKFLLDDGTSATTNAPVFKAALKTLFDHWPSAVSFSDLASRIEATFDPPAAERDRIRPLLASYLVRGYVAHLVAIQAEPFHLTTTISTRPKVSNLVRVLAATQNRVTNLRHRAVILSPFQQQVAQLADGTRTVEQIGDELQRSAPQLVDQELSSEGSEQNRAAIVVRSLEQLARSAVIEC